MKKKDIDDQIEGLILILILAKKLKILHAQRAEFEGAFCELISTAGDLAGTIREVMDEKSERWLESNIASTYEELARELDILGAAELPEVPEIHI